ncbi:hypothetical protein [Burkholderia gladioli]|uniref:hypothetical protein n=1 Tax=Burkholderia gladioli TaxID=28095 RepID=UPI001640DB8D|nr:hypothetical protein [Burkholderia gladioli]
MSDTEQRLAALEIALKHVIQQLPADQLLKAGAAIDSEAAVLRASPAPQRATVISQGGMHRSTEQNPNYEREVTERNAQGRALKQARALIDLWASKV